MTTIRYFMKAQYTDELLVDYLRRVGIVDQNLTGVDYCAVFRKKDELNKVLFSIGLLNICEALHAHCTGTSAEPMSFIEVLFLVSYLKKRKFEWSPSELEYDAAVLNLISISLDEIHKKENIHCSIIL